MKKKKTAGTNSERSNWISRVFSVCRYSWSPRARAPSWLVRKTRRPEGKRMRSDWTRRPRRASRSERQSVSMTRRSRTSARTCSTKRSTTGGSCKGSSSARPARDRATLSAEKSKVSRNRKRAKLSWSFGTSNLSKTGKKSRVCFGVICVLQTVYFKFFGSVIIFSSYTSQDNNTNTSQIITFIDYRGKQTSNMSVRVVMNIEFKYILFSLTNYFIFSY